MPDPHTRRDETPLDDRLPDVPSEQQREWERIARLAREKLEAELGNGDFEGYGPGGKFDFMRALHSAMDLDEFARTFDQRVKRRERDLERDLTHPFPTD